MTCTHGTPTDASCYACDVGHPDTWYRAVTTRGFCSRCSRKATYVADDAGGWHCTGMAAAVAK